MAKKPSASSRAARLTSVKAEDIFNKPLAAKQKSMLKRLRKLPESEIDYSDIPPLTEEQLAKAIRPNRAREYVGVRLDWDVLYWLKEKGPGHSTRINQILRAVMEMSKGKRRKAG